MSMVEFEVKGLTVQAFPNNIKVINSYKLTKRKEIKEAVIEILEKAPLYYTRRSINSLVREWRCHNRFYKLGLFTSHTKDCDLEAKEALYRRFCYFFLGRF